MNTKIDKFKNLALQASKKMENSYYHAPSIVPYVSRMIKLAEENQEFKDDFIQAIIQLWESNGVESEIFEFCCHALMWKELKEYFSSQLIIAKKSDLRAWQVLTNILEAFNPEWDDAKDFYGDYFNI